MDTYTYNADIYCEHCGEAIRESISAKGEAPEEPKNEYSYDSDDYPKGPHQAGESDTPQHCADCGVFLRNPLTSEGLEYVFQECLWARNVGAWEGTALSVWAPYYREELRELERDKVRELLRGADTFTNSYIETLLWSEGDDCSLSESYENLDLDYPAVRSILQDCAAFQEQAAQLLAGADMSQAGHDFLLTRNRHGAGFWDGDWPEHGEELTRIAQSFGEVNAYETDDGGLSIEPLSWKPKGVRP